ncbi:MAG TPA: transposase [Rhodoferax sp.]|nr:transposase [Rhodoferax sp.]
MSTPTPQTQIPATGRRHERYSDEFKRQVVAACHEPDVSKAASALAHSLNANMLRRWVVQSPQVSHGQLVAPTKSPLMATQFPPPVAT